MDEISFFRAGCNCLRRTNRRHSHSGCELLYVTSGRCLLLFPGGVELAGKEGDVFWIPPCTPHERRNPVECRTFYVVYEQTGVFSDVGPRRIETGGDPLVRQWFANLNELNNSCEPEQAGALIRALLLRLERMERRERAFEILHPVLRRACDYLDSHCSREISIGELAVLSGASRSHLNALFRRRFGFGPQRYLADLRMRLARRLLRNPESTVAEAAEQCGFRDVHYFSRCFKAFHGISPGLYRRAPSRFVDVENFRSVGAAHPEPSSAES